MSYHYSHCEGLQLKEANLLHRMGILSSMVTETKRRSKQDWDVEVAWTTTEPIDPEVAGKSITVVENGKVTKFTMPAVGTMQTTHHRGWIPLMLIGIEYRRNHLHVCRLAEALGGYPAHLSLNDWSFIRDNESEVTWELFNKLLTHFV